MIYGQNPDANRHWHTFGEGYRDRCAVPGELERTPHLALIWRSLPGGLFLLTLAITGLGLIVAFSAASPARPDAPQPAPVEARSGGKASR